MASSGEGGPSAAARFTGVEEWRDMTVALCERSVRLQVNGPIVDISYPVIALGLTDVVIMVAVPQRLVPWRPPVVVWVADEESGGPSWDGASVAVSVVARAVEAALLLEPASGYTVPWGADRRWPCGADLRTIDYGPSAIVRDGVNPAEATSVPPPTAESLSPQEFDALFAGALNARPWTGLLSMEWPPPEPEDGEEGPLPVDDTRFGPHGPEDEFVTTGDEAGSRGGLSAPGPALPRAAQEPARGAAAAAETRSGGRRPPTPRGQAGGSS